ncbi:TonB-dependent receptor [Mucilaginibacter ginkgonis]|uniref:TonB-dependent receptor n=1 Tax=Mucilaginibacter ginkgonis TaxID=2682091 RepID=A0A6I4HZU9_9SPHI|nr:TonB-dependent receptor [Mucilaginibacter ginkgonis]QQL49627.1 TonB-dependent receptor [Mucilaginibacter ginkgonis]
MKRIYPLLILLLLATVTQAFAQGVIKGSVIDQKNGEPLIGATISVKNESTGKKISTSVGLDGSFVFRNLSAGSYEVEAHYVSYKDESKHVTVRDNETATVTLNLGVKSRELTEVSIRGRAAGGSDQSARRVEQRSDQMLNAVSARSIEVSPDITVANVTQRVSGVSIQRSNNGEGQYAIIRGMEKRYTYTLINGFKIPSPDNKNRYVPLDIFPADIIDRLEVNKSLTPGMEGDAIAGGINLVLKEAPEDFTVRANLGVGLAQSNIDRGFTKFGANSNTYRSPRILNGDNYNANIGDFSNAGQRFSTSKLPIGAIGSLSIGGRSADKKFGALVSLSYQDVNKDTRGVFFQGDVDPVTNAPVLTDIIARRYSTQQERTSAIARLDYRFNNRNKLIFDGAFINLAQNQYRYSSDTSLNLARTGIGQGRVTEAPRSIRNVQKIYNFSLHGEHKLTDNLAINYTGIYSKATNIENRYSLALITGRTLQANGSVLQQPTTIDALKGQTQTFAYNTDQDKSGFLNLVYSPKIGNTVVDFTFGGMYRNKTRNSTYDQYTLGLPLSNSTQTYNGNIDANTFAVSSLQGTASDALNYNFTENIGGAYAQFKFQVGKLQAIGGARYEHTSQNFVDGLPVTQAGKTGSISYYDVLPSLNLKYMIDSRQNLRASYYSAISRPNPYELVPHTTGDPDADYQEVGNPSLKRATADNYDIRYEFFPKGLDQFLAGVFYKRISNPIEYSLVKPGTGLDYVLQPGNFGNANNYGFELDVTKYIRHFGVRANYAFTQSDITTSKQQKFKDANGNNTFRLVDQTRPLQGQSKNIGNLSFLYKDTKSGLDAQVSAVYTGERINSVSPYLDNDVWQKGFVTLDVSAEKRITKHFSIYAKATNLTNTPFELFIKQPYPPLGPAGTTGQAIELQSAGKNTFVRKDTYQQYYILGVHYKL